MTFWETLGIEPSGDLHTIKRAYAARLKVTRPDDDAQAYQQLRQAYEFAQRHASHVSARLAARADAEAARVALDTEQGASSRPRPFQDAQLLESPLAESVVLEPVVAESAVLEPVSKLNLGPIGDPEQVKESSSEGVPPVVTPNSLAQVPPVDEALTGTDLERTNQSQVIGGVPTRQIADSRPVQRVVVHQPDAAGPQRTVRPARTPAGLVQATLQIWQQRGDDALAGTWPSLQAELFELPLATRDVTSALFAQLVIEHALPARFVAQLAKYFEWQTDYRVEQTLGIQRALLLGKKLTELGAVPPSRAALAALFQDVILFSKMVREKAGWWMWIFATLAGARLPGQFLSLSDEQREALGLSQNVKSQALVWLQRGMLVRTWLVLVGLAWLWSSQDELLGPGQPANIVLYTLPFAFGIFYLQAGLATELQRRWVWPLPRAAHIACALAIAACLVTQAPHLLYPAPAPWSTRISPWSALVVVLLGASCLVAPPPSQRDMAQMRLPIQFVLTFLVCRLIVAAAIPAASQLLLVTYTAGWLAVNELVYEPLRKRVVASYQRQKLASNGRIALLLAYIVGGYMTVIPGFPSLLREVARRTSQRLVFAAAALAVFLPAAQITPMRLLMRVLLFALGLIFANSLLRWYAFKVLAVPARVVARWLVPVLLLSGVTLYVIGSLFPDQTQHPASNAPPVINKPVSNSLQTAPPGPAMSLSHSLGESAPPLVLMRAHVVVTPETSGDNLLELTLLQRTSILGLQNQLEQSLGLLTVARGTTSTWLIDYDASGLITAIASVKLSGNAEFDQSTKKALMSSAPLKLIPNRDASHHVLRHAWVSFGTQ